MNDKPSEIEDEPGAEERFDRAIKNALKMPPQPHRPPQKKSGPKPAKGKEAV